MTMSPEHIDLHRVVDQLDPDQVRALHAIAQQLLRTGTGHVTEVAYLLQIKPGPAVEAASSTRWRVAS